jgi:hypothetical protein
LDDGIDVNRIVGKTVAFNGKLGTGFNIDYLVDGEFLERGRCHVKVLAVDQKARRP